MKITVNRDACTGHARSANVGPDLYELDDEGYCALTEFEVPSGLEESARRGADACPERAITVS